MADKSETAREQALRELGRFSTPKSNARDGVKSFLELGPSEMKRITRKMMERPGNTPEQKAYYEDMLRDLDVYEWNKGAAERANSDTAKWSYMPEFTGYFSKSYDNLTPRQIEAEYSTLFDGIVKRDGGIRPYDLGDFYYRLKEQLDANSGVLGERLDRGKDDRLDMRAQDSQYKDLVRALLEARQRRPAYGGPR